MINRRFEGLKDLGHCYPHVKLSQSQLIHEVGQLKGQNINNQIHVMELDISFLREEGSLNLRNGLS